MRNTVMFDVRSDRKFAPRTRVRPFASAIVALRMELRIDVGRTFETRGVTIALIIRAAA